MSNESTEIKRTRAELAEAEEGYRAATRKQLPYIEAGRGVPRELADEIDDARERRARAFHRAQLAIDRANAAKSSGRPPEAA